MAGSEQAPAVVHFIPKKIMKILREGWKDHISLFYLTDAACESYEAANSQPRAKITMKGDQLFATAAEDKRTEDKEFSLDLKEWTQAYNKFLYAVIIHFGESYAEYWKIHFSNIFTHDRRDSEWPALMRYCAEIRRRATLGAINPAVWHETIYTHILHKMRYPDLVAPAGHSTVASSQAHTTSFRATKAAPEDADTAKTRGSRNKLAKCFRCAVPGHSPMSCNRNTQANGKAVIVTKAPGGKPQIDGAPFCFAYNSARGCTRNPCTNPPHICSLCKSTEHGAQQCSV